jgi:ZIP family zinc transporter
LLFDGFSADVIAATTAVAAGAILAMLSDTMIPEAFEEAHNFAGLITVIGFLCAFILTKVAGQVLLKTDGKISLISMVI